MQISHKSEVLQDSDLANPAEHKMYERATIAPMHYILLNSVSCKKNKIDNHTATALVTSSWLPLFPMD